MILSDIIKDLYVQKIQGSIEVKITGISYNSNNVKPGNVFVCISGLKADGHDFAAQAVERGAVAIISEKALEGISITVVQVDNTRRSLAFMAARFYDFPQRKLKLIGVTGTNGKTTTTYLIKAILESQGKKVGLIGTNQNIIGKAVMPSKHTTPDSLELMELFTRMAEVGVEYVVMEVSSHSLVLDRVAACKFDVAAFTNITQDHLDFHGTMEAYLDAKAKLFKMCDTGVFNIDDEKADYLINGFGGRVITYGTSDKCDVRGENLNMGEQGVEFDVGANGQKAHAVLGIPGRFSVYNALTAISCCLAAGFDLDKIVDALKSAGGVKGRVEVVDTGLDFTVIIDYAHTPDGLCNVLSTIRGFAGGRIVTLFGCGGDRDKLKRPHMGRIAGDMSDYCIVTSDNPRSEEPNKIIEGIIEGMRETDCEYKVIENRFEAIEFALDNAKAGDIILLAGKGHETYQILKDRTIDFDEREIVLKLLNVG